MTESFNLSKNTWNKLASIPKAVLLPGFAVYNGRLYRFGGTKAYIGAFGTPVNYVQVYQPYAGGREMVKLTTFASFVLALSALLALTPRHPAPASPDSVPQDDSASVSYTEFSAPGAGTTAYLGTTATAINTGNEVVGFYLDSQTVYHGYLPGLGGPALSGLVALSCFNKVSALP